MQEQSPYWDVWPSVTMQFIYHIKCKTLDCNSTGRIGVSTSAYWILYGVSTKKYVVLRQLSQKVC